MTLFVEDFRDLYVLVEKVVEDFFKEKNLTLSDKEFDPLYEAIDEMINPYVEDFRNYN